MLDVDSEVSGGWKGWKHVFRPRLQDSFLWVKERGLWDISTSQRACMKATFSPQDNSSSVPQRTTQGTSQWDELPVSHSMGTPSLTAPWRAAMSQWTRVSLGCTEVPTSSAACYWRQKVIRVVFIATYGSCRLSLVNSVKSTAWKMWICIGRLNPGDMDPVSKLS